MSDIPSGVSVIGQEDPIVAQLLKELLSKQDAIISKLGDLSDSQKTSAFGKKDWKEVLEFIKKMGKRQDTTDKTYKKAYDNTLKEFTKAQQKQLKEFQKLIDFNKTVIQSMQKQLEVFKKDENHTLEFLKYLDKKDVSKKYEDNESAYFKTMNKFQNENLGGTFLDAALKKSPALQFMLKRTPSAPGSAYRRRMETQSQIYNAYNSKYKKMKQRDYADFSLGEGSGAYMRSLEDEINRTEMGYEGKVQDFIRAKREKGAKGSSNPRGADGRFTGKSKANPTESDLERLPAIYGEPALHVASFLEELVKIEKGDKDNGKKLKFTDEKGGLFDNALKNLSGSAIASLVATALPVILTALAAGAATAALLAIMNKVKEDNNKTLEDKVGLTEEDKKKLKAMGIDVDAQQYLNEAQAQAYKDLADGKITDSGNFNVATNTNPTTATAYVLAQKGQDDTLENYFKKGGLTARWRLNNGKYEYSTSEGRGDKPMEWIDSTLREGQDNPIFGDLWNNRITKAYPDAVNRYPGGDPARAAMMFIQKEPGKKFHVGGKVQGNPGEEQRVTVLPGERVLSPSETTQYEASSKVDKVTVNTSKIEELLGVVAQLQKDLLVEMKTNTKAVESQELVIPEKRNAILPTRGFVS